MGCSVVCRHPLVKRDCLSTGGRTQWLRFHSISFVLLLAPRWPHSISFVALRCDFGLIQTASFNFLRLIGLQNSKDLEDPAQRRNIGPI